MKEKKKFYLTPKRIFTTERYLLPPYEIKKSDNYYYLKRF
jgi:hypothetical protein